MLRKLAMILVTGLAIFAGAAFAQSGAPDQMLVATAPGWRLFEVTPVPASRRASSLAKRMLASLLRP